MFKKYINESEEIMAVQFTEDNKNQVYNSAKEIQYNIWHDFRDGKPCMAIPSDNDTSICSIGDYLILKILPNDCKKFYVYKEKSFKRLYSES